MRKCELRDLGRIGWADAYAMQQDLVSERQDGRVPDQFLIMEHPHVVTMGRNGQAENLLASPEVMERAGITFHETDRGGDVTYHGPGQLIGYPIVDLDGWKRDVRAYVRGVEQVLIDTLSEFGVNADRLEGKDKTGVWVNGAKIAAIGIHISRWVTSHGFALNVDTDLSYFQYIVPCGLTKPVTSMRKEGSDASRADVVAALGRNFGRVFDCEIANPELATERA
jgi:lipoyl(octanoyl) transferase